MDKVQELDLQWQALRYAVDQIDIAWSYNPDEYAGALFEQKRVEMLLHRRQLLRLQDKILAEKNALEMK